MTDINCAIISPFSHHHRGLHHFQPNSGCSFAFFFNTFMNILSFPPILMALTSLPIAKCINMITFLVELLGHLKFMGMMALSRLCPLNLPDQQDHQTEDQEQSTNSTYVLVMNGSSPSLVPAYTLMALIKMRVPVIEYSIFVERHGSVAHEMAYCSVCLNSVKRSHEIRELSNCSHVFHRECLDRWVDEAKVTCPLCRTMLLPAASKDQMMML
ncbi:hypothetical protein I3842_11G108200 [Carya illinoinensis]|uniref:RING-type domain-containing protein n=1 Tax=Carya illinoinensis TaxID=32201 RepID=A0A922IYX8_CARIL|nr:hypothetical protein I3842_11G108200 [Carya illinoinensis]